MNSHRGNRRYPPRQVADTMAETVSLFLGKPVECCLKFGHGLRRDTTRGPRVLFTLTDERKLWVDPPVADQIEAKVGAGETFWICKRKAPGNSQRDVYDVWTGGRDRGGAAPAAQAWEGNFTGSEDRYTPGPTEARRDPDATPEMIQMARTIDIANARKRQAREQSEAAAAAAAIAPPTPPRIPPPAIAAPAGNHEDRRHVAWEAIEQSTKDAIDVLAAVRQHAQQYGLLIEAEDARSLICTMIIGKQQRGGR